MRDWVQAFDMRELGEHRELVPRERERELPQAVGLRMRWHVSDLAVPRHLLAFLVAYDALAFYAYLKTLAAAHGAGRGQSSFWLLTNAAHVFFKAVKRRCYPLAHAAAGRAPMRAIDVNFADDADAWDVLDDLQGRGLPLAGGHSSGTSGARHTERRPTWLPQGMDLVLEEL